MYIYVCKCIYVYGLCGCQNTQTVIYPNICTSVLMRVYEHSAKLHFRNQQRIFLFAGKYHNFTVK